MSLIFEALGSDGEDVEVIAAQEDFHDFADLIVSLVELRRASGKTQQDIAEIMGTKQSAVSEIESSSANPSVQRLQRYARAVGARLLLDAEPLRISQDGRQVVQA